MNDDDLAEIERRVTLALGGGRDVVLRCDVLALLAECRALRRLPDVSGLMSAADLAAMRGRLVGNWPATHDAAALWDAWHIDFLALLAHAEAANVLIRELYGVIADLHADDPGRQALLERGRAEGREQAARELDRLADAEDALSPGAVAPGQHFEVVEHTFIGRGLSRAADAIRALGPCRPPLPPCEEAREAARLREALRGVVAARDGYDEYQVSLNGVYGAIDAARAALGEGP